MEFGFAQVERTLASLHSVRSDQRSAFSARLKNFQRMGFPRGVNTGRGKAATYGVEHLIQMGIALELSQLGLSPERAVGLLERSKPTVAGVVLLASTEGQIADEGLGPIGARPYGLYFDPRCLSPLMEGGPRDHAPVVEQVFGWSGSGMIEGTPDHDMAAVLQSSAIPRFAYVSISFLMKELAKSIDAGSVVPQFHAAAMVWARDYLNEVRRMESDGDDPQA